MSSASALDDAAAPDSSAPSPVSMSCRARRVSKVNTSGSTDATLAQAPPLDAAASERCTSASIPGAALARC